MLQQDNLLRVVRGYSWWRFRRELLRGSREILVMCDGQGVLRYKPTSSPELMREAIRLHSHNVRQNQMLKEDRKRRTSRIQAADGQTYIVKEYRKISWLGYFSRDQRGWLGSNRLIGSAECLGWQRNADLSAAYLLFRDVGQEDLYMANNLSLPLEEAVPIYRQAGKMLAGMHAQGIYHADTKPANFVFTRSSFGGPLLTIIDCDDIRVSLFLSRRCCRKNLAQFIGCLWCLQKMTTRVALAQAFLRGYGSLAANAAGSVLRSPAEQRKLAAICHKLYPRHRLENGQLLQELFDPEKISLLEAPAD